MKRLGLAASLIVLAAPAIAQDRITERFERKRVAPGELVTRDLPCPRGTSITGGGYALFDQPDDRITFVVTSSYPTAEGSWRINLRNISQENQELAFRLYALCQED